MDDVKRYLVGADESDLCGCGASYSIKETESPDGDWVSASDFDAQRLRADTAEAELERAECMRESYKIDAGIYREKLAAAEQRIAELSADNQQLRKLLEQTLAALNPTAKLSKSIRAALNPNPEAGSHED